jgi:hypothetical protein
MRRTALRIAAGGCLAAALAFAPAAGVPGAPAGSPERRMLDLVNAERSRHQLRRLVWDDDLARLARDHAADMLRSQRVSHESSRDGATFETRLARSGYRASAAAENVAYDRDVERTHEGLMKSPGHRANILSPELTAVGIGLVRDSDGSSIYVAQDFATPIESLSDEEAGRRVRQAVSAARQTAGRDPAEEDRSLSRLLETSLDRLVKSDSVKVDASILPGPGWVVAYTTPEPSQLPAEAKKRLGRGGPLRAFGVATVFARSPSYPFGTYWVVLGTLEEQ